ncbi:MAG: hypothetical protein IJ008_04535 [Clostridia bacterium]|nr:hypothetical protein [Clostridia bacterium]
MEIYEINLKTIKDKKIVNIIKSLEDCEPVINFEEPSEKANTFLNNKCKFMPKGFLDFYNAMDGGIFGNLNFFSVSRLNKTMTPAKHFNLFNTQEIKEKYLTKCGLLLEGDEDIFFFACDESKSLYGFLNTVKNDTIFYLDIVDEKVKIFNNFYKFLEEKIKEFKEYVKQNFTVAIENSRRVFYPIFVRADPDNDDGYYDIGDFFDIENDDGYFDLDESWFE